MRKSRFAEEQVIAIPAEQEQGPADRGALPGARPSADGRPSSVAWTCRAQAEGFGRRERAPEAASGRIDARQCRVERHAGKVLKTPRAGREAAVGTMSRHTISQPRACRLAGVDPKTVRRESEPDHPNIRALKIAAERRRFGYRRDQRSGGAWIFSPTCSERRVASASWT